MEQNYFSSSFRESFLPFAAKYSSTFIRSQSLTTISLSVHQFPPWELNSISCREDHLKKSMYIQNKGQHQTFTFPFSSLREKKRTVLLLLLYWKSQLDWLITQGSNHSNSSTAKTGYGVQDILTPMTCSRAFFYYY